MVARYTNFPLLIVICAFGTPKKVTTTRINHNFLNAEFKDYIFWRYSNFQDYLKT